MRNHINRPCRKLKSRRIKSVLECWANRIKMVLGWKTFINITSSLNLHNHFYVPTEFSLFTHFQFAARYWYNGVLQLAFAIFKHLAFAIFGAIWKHQIETCLSNIPCTVPKYLWKTRRLYYSIRLIDFDSNLI